MWPETKVTRPARQTPTVHLQKPVMKNQQQVFKDCLQYFYIHCHNLSMSIRINFFRGRAIFVYLFQRVGAKTLQKSPKNSLKFNQDVLKCWQVKRMLVCWSMDISCNILEVLFQFYLWDQSSVTIVWNTGETGDIHTPTTKEQIYSTTQCPWAFCLWAFTGETGAFIPLEI